MNKKIFLLTLILVLLPAAYLAAQYPRIPKEVQDEANKLMEEARRRSDLAWEKALPIIEAEAKPVNLIFPGLPVLPICLRPPYLHFRVPRGRRFQLWRKGRKSDYRNNPERQRSRLIEGSL